jgi:hypothetical protein
MQPRLQFGQRGIQWRWEGAIGCTCVGCSVPDFLCGVSVDIMEMVEKGQARYIAETSDGVAHCGEEDGRDCGDEEIAEDGIRIMSKDKLCEEGLVLAIVLHNSGIRGLFLVVWKGWRSSGGLECNAVDAVLFVVCGVDGEGQMAIDSISSHRVD